MNYRAPICPACGHAAVDRRYLDWHYTLDARCRQLDLDSIEVDHRSPAWLAVIETTTNPEKFTSIMRWGAERLSIPSYLVVLPAVIGLGPLTPIRVRVIYWPPNCGDKPAVGRMALREWGRFIEQEIHQLLPKAV